MSRQASQVEVLSEAPRPSAAAVSSDVAPARSMLMGDANDSGSALGASRACVLADSPPPARSMPTSCGGGTLGDRVVVPPRDSSRCSATGAQSSPSMSSHDSAHAASPQRHGGRSLKSMSATRRSAGRRKRRVGHAVSVARGSEGFCIQSPIIWFLDDLTTEAQPL